MDELCGTCGEPVDVEFAHHVGLEAFHVGCCPSCEVMLQNDWSDREPWWMLAVASAVAQHVTAVRASSWGSLFDCAHKWEGEHLLGMRKASGLRAQLGTAIHASTAQFDAGRLPGGNPLTVDETAGAFVDALHNPDRDVDFSQDDLTLKEAEKIGLKLHSLYCLDLSPQFMFKSVEQQLAPLDIDCGNGVIHVIDTVLLPKE